MTGGNERKSPDSNQEEGNQPLLLIVQDAASRRVCWGRLMERSATADDVRTLLTRAVYGSGAKFQQLFVDNAKLR